MHMSFWWGAKIDNFLFYGFNIKNVFELIVTCVGIAGLAFLFEWIKLLQAQLKQKELIIRAKQLKAICPSIEESSLLPDNEFMNKPLDLSFRNRAMLHVWDASLWFSIHNLGYLIMLTVMAYNFWMFLSVLIGGSFGYFIFGQRFMKLNIENCQVIKDTYCMSNCARPDSRAIYVALKRAKAKAQAQAQAQASAPSLNPNSSPT